MSLADYACAELSLANHACAKQKNTFKDKIHPIRSKVKEFFVNKKNQEVTWEPLKCWCCGGSHFYRNFPHKRGGQSIHTIREDTTVGEVAQNIPKISTSFDNHQAYY